MPVEFPIQLTKMDREEFAKLDYEVMRHAYRCQNDLGRLCDEKIYQNDLSERLRKAGFEVTDEVRLIVRHRDFEKIYELDLIIQNASIYELKAASAFTGKHEAQLLNYMLLTGSSKGKLVNFRPARVDAKFVNAPPDLTDRHQFDFDLKRWSETHHSERAFRECTLNLLKDWGSLLDVALYSEALIHFAGGASTVDQRLPLTHNGTHLGFQRFHLLNPEAAFRITAFTQGLPDFEHHLKSLLSLTPLRTIHWLNFAARKIQLTSLSK